MYASYIYRFTELLGLERASEDLLVQTPAKTGPPGARDTGTHPGEF